MHLSSQSYGNETIRLCFNCCKPLDWYACVLYRISLFLIMYRKYAQPESLNYCLIVYSMLSILYLLYSKFLHQVCSSETWRKAIETLDEKICTLVLKDLTE
eukprot:524763_1